MIKKIYTLLLMACCIGFVGCSDDDETVQATLKVVKSDVSYDCFGGEGTIEVNSADPVTATSSVNWCQATASGNVIQLKVAPNQSESRSLFNQHQEVLKLPSIRWEMFLFRTLKAEIWVRTENS